MPSFVTPVVERLPGEGVADPAVTESAMPHLAVLALAALLQGEAAGGVRGTVSEAEAGRPVEGVAVEVVGAGVAVETGADGVYLVGEVPPGWQRLRFTRLGFRSVDVQVFVVADRTSRVDVSLPVHPLPLRALDVTGARARRDDPGSLASGDAAHVGSRSLAVPREGGHPLVDQPELHRLLGTLPEVALRPDGGGGIHLRGGGADQTLVLLNGAPILGGFNAMGMAGPVDPDALEVVDVFAGVVPAQYGGRLSGVVAMETRRPDPEAWHVRAGSDGFTNALTLDGPMIPGHAGLLLSGRRSGGGVLAGLVERAAGLPRFHDLFGELTVPLAEGEVRVSGYRSSDRLAFGSPQGGAADANRFRWSSGTDAVAWRRTSGAVRFDVVAWRADTESRAEWMDELDRYAVRSRLDQVGVRWLVGVPRPAGWIRAGIGWEGFELLHRAEGAADAAIVDRRTSELSLFGEWHRVWADRVGVTAALRTAVAAGADPGLEPRLSLSWAPRAGTVVAVGYDRSRQLLQSRGNEESVLDVAIAAPYPGHLGVDEDGAATADQWTASLRTQVDWGGSLRIDGYRKRLRGLVLVAPTTGEPVAVGPLVRGAGDASGGQLSVELMRGPWRASASYHLGRASREIRSPVDGSEVDYDPQFHRTHWTQLGASLRATRHFTLRAALRAGSGAPTTPLRGPFVWEQSDPVLGEGDLAGIPVYDPGGAPNGERLPGYLRIDLGIHGAWDFELAGRPGRVTSFLAVENLLDRGNLLAYRVVPGSSALAPVRLNGVTLNAGFRVRY